MNKVTIRHRKTGESVTGVKSYGNGYIDATGKYYHSADWKFVPEKEL